MTSVCGSFEFLTFSGADCWNALSDNYTEMRLAWFYLDFTYLQRILIILQHHSSVPPSRYIICSVATSNFFLWMISNPMTLRKGRAWTVLIYYFFLLLIHANIIAIFRTACAENFHTWKLGCKKLYWITKYVNCGNRVNADKQTTPLENTFSLNHTLPLFFFVI